MVWYMKNDLRALPVLSLIDLFRHGHVSETDTGNTRYDIWRGRGRRSKRIKAQIQLVCTQNQGYLSADPMGVYTERREL